MCIRDREKGERPYNTHIVHAVLHQFGPQPHQPQDRLRTPEQQHADAYLSLIHI